MIRLSLSYRFGKLKASVKKTETTIDNDDVVGGISKGKQRMGSLDVIKWEFRRHKVQVYDV